MNHGPFPPLLLAASLLTPLAAEPAVIWTIPSPARGEQESRYQEIRLSRVNDEE